MENKKIGIAVIGCGGRARGVIRRLLEFANGKIELISAYDPAARLRDESFEDWKVDLNKLLVADSYQQAIDAEGVDWVFVCSPNAFHKEHILYAFSRNKHVFSEKPLATTIEDCKAIYEAHQAKPHLTFITGFVLRYAPLYREAKKLIDSGKFGKIVSIEANENVIPECGGYIMSNWRRKTEFAGPHILEKCCHDLDLLNWFTGSLPSKVFFLSSRNIFKSENIWMQEKYGVENFMGWRMQNDVATPFNDDNDLFDTNMGTALYRNGVQVSFCSVMSNAIAERRMRFNCTEGTVIVDAHEGEIKYNIIGEKGFRRIHIAGDGHAGGDPIMTREIFETITENAPVKCSGSEGLESAVLALSFDESARTGKIVDVEPVWKYLER